MSFILVHQVWFPSFYCIGLTVSLGISPEKWLNKSKAARSKLPFPSIKILFPSLATVDATVLGRPVSLAPSLLTITVYRGNRANDNVWDNPVGWRNHVL